MEKKAVIPILVPITVGIILALALLVAVIFAGTALATWVLAKSIFYLAGIGVIVAGVFLAVKGKIMPIWFWIIGGALVVLPYVFKGLQDATLGVLIG